MVQPVLNPFDASDYPLFSQRVQLRLGIRLADYKEDQMKRRLATMAQRAKCPSFLTYFMAIERDSTLLSEFLDQMTINVTELLRNPNLFEILVQDVLPGLIADKHGPSFNAWSAGCSYGAEACTLAMLLTEMAPTLPVKIKGTDVDLSILSKANAPVFTSADMMNISPARREQHFMSFDGNSFMPKTAVRSKLTFTRHDLLADPYPVAQYDLVLCRNVVIYFTDSAKERIYRGIFDSLRPGGVLFVGGTERLSDHASVGFRLIKPFFYVKPK